jgi:hypothetical protein
MKRQRFRRLPMSAWSDSGRWCLICNRPECPNGRGRPTQPPRGNTMDIGRQTKTYEFETIPATEGAPVEPVVEPVVEPDRESEPAQ